MHTKDDTICIRKVDYSDTSQILTLFCRQTGKLSAIAKGSRRSKSHFGSPIEIFSAGEAVFVASKGGSLAILAEFEHLSIFSGIRRSLYSMNAGLLACELLNLLIDEYDPHPPLYDKFKTFLTLLSQPAENKNKLLLLIEFELAILEEIGTAIPAHNCGNCSAVLKKNENIFFCAQTGGFICRDCEGSFVEKYSVSPQVLSVITDTPNSDRVSDIAIKQAQKVLIRHFAYITHKMPKAAAFFM